MRSVLAVCLLVLATTLGASSTTDSTLSGHVRAADGRFHLSADVVGGLQGRLSLDLGVVGIGSIGGHAWRLEVQRQDGAGAWYDAGILVGTVVDGVMTATEDGHTVNGDGIELAVSSGDGELADVVSGSGRLRFTVQGGETPVASGTLTLTF